LPDLVEGKRVSAIRTTSALRTSALIALGAFVVHQLRYLVGEGAGGQGHSYLGVVLPVLMVLAAASAVGATVVALSTGPANRRSAGWMTCTVALLVIFAAQETAEGLAPFAHGGWIAVPIAILVGRIVSLLLAAFRSIEQRLAVTRPTPRAPSVLGRARPCRARPLMGKPLAFGLARRPPPLVAG
jgi:hypothetical protein